MTLYAAVHIDAVEYVHYYERVLGIFSTRPLADEAVLTETEEDSSRKLEEYEVREIQLDVLWN